MVAVEFVKDRQTKEPRVDIVKKIIQYAHQRGVVFMSAGIFSNAIRFMPPVVITDAQVAYGMDIFEAALQEDQR
jgi:4-aminobutyrate aminotransferase/(S)-3-amino-2-methylpropionate transaminase